MLEVLARRWRFRLTEVDITADWETYQQHSERIPVIAVGDRVVSFGRVEKDRLSEALQAAR